MVRYRLLATVAAVAAFMALAAVASADHSWNGYHWARTSSPFALQLEDDLTSAEWKGHLVNVSADWTQSTVLDTTIVNKAVGKKNCPAIAGKVRVCNGKYGFNGWLGVATIWLSGGHITQGTAKVNDSYFNLDAYNNADAKRHVVCQEVGHTLGLDHQHDVSDSCMNDQGSALFLASAVRPNQHDYDQLAAIYGSHTDSTTTVSSAAPSGNGRNGSPPDDALPPGAGPQQGNLFARDLGGGRMIITFVIWAQPGAPGAR